MAVPSLPSKDLNVAEKVACDNFIITGLKANAYRIYQIMKTGSVKATALKNANAFFNKPHLQEYVAYQRYMLQNKFFEEYMVRERLSKSKLFSDRKDLQGSQVDDWKDYEIRGELAATLQGIIAAPDKQENAIAAAKALAELMAAKKKPDEETSESKLIHFYLPADICENCPNKQAIYDAYKTEEDNDDEDELIDSEVVDSEEQLEEVTEDDEIVEL